MVVEREAALDRAEMRAWSTPRAMEHRMNLAIAVLGPERPCRGLRPHDAPVILPELEMNDLEDYTLYCL
jgi:hypothetical protein